MIRGWRSLLEGFGIAKDPALFGKMLKRAPFMYNMNPPKVGDEDLSHVVDSDASTTASGFVAYGALKVLELLSSQKFPDLDKIIRTQPWILLVDVSEVSARATFLYNLFADAKAVGVDALSLPSYSRKKQSNDYLYGYSGSDSDYLHGRSGSESAKGGSLAKEGDGGSRSEAVIADRDSAVSDSAIRISQSWSSNLYGRSDVSEDSFKYFGNEGSSRGSGSDIGKGGIGDRINNSGSTYGSGISSSKNSVYIKKKTKLRGLSKNATYDISDMENENDMYVSSWVGEYIPAAEDGGVLEAGMIVELEEQDDMIGISHEERMIKERMQKIESNDLNKHGQIAHEMLGSLLLTYPAVLSIDHQQMRAAGNALRSVGLRRGEVLLIARKHPQILGRDPNLLIGKLNSLLSQQFRFIIDFYISVF